MIRDEFYNYLDGVRVIFLTNRKSGKNSKDRAKFHKLISYNRDDLVKKVELLKQIGNSLYPHFRIYVSLNERDVRKAVHVFKTKMLAADFQNDKTFYIDFYNRWIGSLMKPATRKTKLFLIDVDGDKELLQKVKLLLPHRNYTTHKTPNGYHLYSLPFDVRLLQGIDGVEVKKDGLMLVYWS